MGQVLELPKRRRKAPTAQNGKVALPRRRPNKELRTREYLTPAEADRLISAAGASGRYKGRARGFVGYEELAPARPFHAPGLGCTGPWCGHPITGTTLLRLLMMPGHDWPRAIVHGLALAADMFRQTHREPARLAARTGR